MKKTNNNYNKNKEININRKAQKIDILLIFPRTRINEFFCMQN